MWKNGYEQESLIDLGSKSTEQVYVKLDGAIRSIMKALCTFSSQDLGFDRKSAEAERRYVYTYNENTIIINSHVIIKPDGLRKLGQN